MISTSLNPLRGISWLALRFMPLSGIVVMVIARLKDTGWWRAELPIAE